MAGSSASLAPGTLYLSSGYHSSGVTLNASGITCSVPLTYSLTFSFPVTQGKSGTFALWETVEEKKQDRVISSHVKGTPTKYYKYMSSGSWYAVDTILDTLDGNFVFLYSISETSLQTSYSACAYKYDWQRPSKITSGSSLPVQQIENNQTYKYGAYTYYGRYANDYQENDIFVKTSTDSQSGDTVVDAIYVCAEAKETIESTYNQYDYSWKEIPLDVYTKTEIDTMIGDIESLLSEV